MVDISDAAIDLMLSCEVTNQATYNALYQHPTWPGGDSGITIGIGYDLGYATQVQVHTDWEGHLSVSDTQRLGFVAGIKGEPAEDLLYSVAPVVVPYGAALAVFETVDIPRALATVCAVFPNADTLSPDSLGALVSLVYNRGADCSNTPRRLEMYEIKIAMGMKKFEIVPGLIRDMKRLWASTSGLVTRREAEAKLFEKGLACSPPGSS